MIYQNVEFHNIEEVRKMPGSDGVRLQRVPETVRTKLNETAQMRIPNAKLEGVTRVLHEGGEEEVEYLFDRERRSVQLYIEDCG